ncbi:NAD(P)-binding domain-containing protein, partial [Flavobacteriaceae bacterium]|nr:NAD(P)-binding domain-containing protein [Flavobacteriaceae bacterium]
MITYISGIKKLSQNTYEKLTTLTEISYVVINNDRELIEALNNCDVLWFRLNHKLSRVILKNVRCKYILCAVTGLDHIDTKACQDFGIKVISLKGEREFLKEVRATAEHTICLLLSLIRKTKKAFTHVEDGNWNRKLFKGTELYRKKIGVLGFGRLGKIVAEYASVFGMDVYYYDINPSCKDERYKRCKSLKDLVKKVDVLSIHVNYDNTNHHLINSEVLSIMNDNIQIINTSRGGIVNEKDIIEFLENHKKTGYAT